MLELRTDLKTTKTDLFRMTNTLDLTEKEIPAQVVEAPVINCNNSFLENFTRPDGDTIQSSGLSPFTG